MVHWRDGIEELLWFPEEFINGLFMNDLLFMDYL